jgi:hypothetical protein
MTVSGKNSWKGASNRKSELMQSYDIFLGIIFAVNFKVRRSDYDGSYPFGKRQKILLYGQGEGDFAGRRQPESLSDLRGLRIRVPGHRARGHGSEEVHPDGRLRSG